MKCILVGNYGAGNVGDEALKDYFLTRFPWVTWSVLSANPEPGQYARLPAGLRSLLGLRWIRTLGAFRKTDAVVFGGGSLFTDVESSFACVIWMIHAAVARACGKPIFLAFQGVGPVRTSVGKWCTKWVLKRAKFVSVRDPESVAKIAEFDLHINVVLSADPVFIVIQNSESHRAQNVINVIPRHNSDSAFQSAFENVLKSHSGHAVHLVSLQPDDSTEQETLSQLQKTPGGPFRIIPVRTLQELCDEVGSASFVLTQRYHGAIAALCCGIPTEILSQGQGDKLWALREAVQSGTADQEVLRLRTKALEGESALESALRALNAPQASRA